MPKNQPDGGVTYTHQPEHNIAISARGLSKTYAGSKKQAPHPALKSIDLDVPVGKIFGLLGPNGAGKSTFINIMAGIVMKSAGSLTVWNTDIDANPRQARANIGIVPQELNVDAYFTPRQTVEMTAGLFGVPKSERRTDQILETVGLTDQADLYARRLSGGMRRRLLVAKAMVHSPPILVLDEPTAGVDVALRQKLWENIQALNEQGVTIVLTTHYLEEAQALCDHVAIINKGELITSKPKAELMATAGRKELHMTVANPPPTQPENQQPGDMPDALAQLGAKWNDGTLSVLYDPKLINAAAIIAAATSTGIEVQEVSTVEPDLEDIFLELTN